MHKKIILTILIIAIATFSLTACGKRSAPKAYQDSGYPHTYPRK